MHRKWCVYAVYDHVCVCVHTAHPYITCAWACMYIYTCTIHAGVSNCCMQRNVAENGLLCASASLKMRISAGQPSPNRLLWLICLVRPLAALCALGATRADILLVQNPRCRRATARSRRRKEGHSALVVGVAKAHAPGGCHFWWRRPVLAGTDAVWRL